jgi:hypothetical protein
MRALWERDMQEAWNVKESLKRDRRHTGDVRRRLERRFKADVVEAICRRRATAESSLARVYSMRGDHSKRAVHIGLESARNALLYYRKLTGWHPGPQL